MRQKLFEIPFLGIPIYGYGTLVLIGVLAALWVLGQGARNRGWKPQVAQDNAIYIVLVGLLGGRIFYFVQFHDQYEDDLFAFFRLWEGGLVLYGALFGGTACLLVLCRFRGLPPLPFLDVIGPAVAVGVAFGRLGCLMNGCCWGRVCHAEFPLALIFPAGSPPAADPVTGRFDPLTSLPIESFPLQPTQIYSSLNAFFIAWILWRIGLGRPRAEAREIAREGRQLRDSMKAKGLKERVLAHVCELAPDGKPSSSLSGDERALVETYTPYIEPYLAIQGRRAGLRFAKPGTVIGAGSLLYGMGRFVLESIRGDHHPAPGSWPVSQTISCFMVILGLGLILLPSRPKTPRGVGSWAVEDAGTGA